MSEQKWTPGPWRVVESADGLWDIQSFGAKERYDVTGPVYKKEDADLIAAALALVEALEEALNRMQHLERWRHGEANNVPVCVNAINQACAALRQAKGEEA